MKTFFLTLICIGPAYAMPEMPKHAHKVNHIWKWECDRGYIQERNECVKVRIPRHAHPTPAAHGWECDEGYEKYRGECDKKSK